MLIDITGIPLTPGNMGKDCAGNGLHLESECCCDECDFMLCCTFLWTIDDCRTCGVHDCPRKDDDRVIPGGQKNAGPHPKRAQACVRRISGREKRNRYAGETKLHSDFSRLQGRILLCNSDNLAIGSTYGCGSCRFTFPSRCRSCRKCRRHSGRNRPQSGQ